MIKLLAFVDGSSYSKSVCEHAAWVAKRTEASVNIVHVLGRASDSGRHVDLSGSIGLGARTALLEELATLDGQLAKLSHQRGRAILEDAKAILNSAGIDQVTTQLRNEGIVEAEQSLEEQTDLLVIGKRGEGFETDELHLGSSIERVIRASHKPVLVAPRQFKQIEKVLIAFDGGPSAQKAVRYLASNPAFSNLKCQLLYATSPTETARARLEEAATQLRDSGYVIETAIEAGQADKVITEKIKNESIDLLLMGAYGHSRMRSLIIGSTTTSMILASKIPVLLFR
jgi:nucleotide-binding universal stress UspA family protein